MKGFRTRFVCISSTSNMSCRLELSTAHKLERAYTLIYSFLKKERRLIQHKFTLDARKS